MKIPLVHEILKVSKHFSLDLYSCFYWGNVLWGQNIVDYHKIVVYLCYQLIVISQNITISIVSKIYSINDQHLPNRLNLTYHISQLCLFLRLDSYTHKLSPQLIELKIFKILKTVNNIPHINKKILYLLRIFNEIHRSVLVAQKLTHLLVVFLL